MSIIGVGEDGLKGLTSASREALQNAEIVMGPPRHLDLIGPVNGQTVAWPVPYQDGVDHLLSLRGHRVVVLASGDPFWFGAGGTLSRHLGADEWVCLPTTSTFSLAANTLGWPIETTTCLGLHASPLQRLRPHLAPNARMIVLLRDGNAVSDLAAFLTETGFGASRMIVMQSMGGPRARRVTLRADTPSDQVFEHPLCVGLDISGDGRVLPLASGRPDDWFDSDGQITKQPVRAMTLSALAPRPFEHLWDIGGGSGSIGIEWLMCHPSVNATTIEPRAERAERIKANALRLGVDRLTVITGSAPAALAELEKPQVVFVGGGLSAALLAWFETHLAPGTRIVANGVTLETESVLIEAHARLGGTLMRVEIARAEPLGARRGWNASYPITQWSITL